MRNDRIDAATSSLCFISRCKVPHYFLPAQYPKVGKKKEIYQSLSPKISFTTYKSPFSLPTNSERPSAATALAPPLSPTLNTERCCSNANKSPTFAVKRRTFTTPVQCCFSGYACWHVAACRDEISTAALRQPSCGRPRVSV